MLPKLTLRIKLVGYLKNNFGAMIRSNGNFFLNLHGTGYTVFLILCSVKLTKIYEDSNFYVEERRIIKSVLRL